MKKVTLAAGLFLSIPLIASAQTLQLFLTNFLLFINGYIMPFLIGIAFLFFVYNAIRFFVIGGSNEEGQEKAKALAIYGVAAFVIIIIFWGIVNLLSSSLGLDGESMPTPDYAVNQALRHDTCDPGETSVPYESFGMTFTRCE